MGNSDWEPSVPVVQTTEPEHDHWCEECGSVWSHADDDCLGPRLSATSQYTCPMCVDDHK